MQSAPQSPAPQTPVALAPHEREILQVFARNQTLALKDAEAAKTTIEVVCSVILGRAGVDPTANYRLNADLTALVPVPAPPGAK